MRVDNFVHIDFKEEHILFTIFCTLVCMVDFLEVNHFVSDPTLSDPKTSSVGKAFFL